MNKKTKVFHAANRYDYSNWIPNSEITRNIEEADLVLFEGGEDVSPSFYGESKGRWTYCNEGRDLLEREIFNKAQKLGIPCLGICRGNQLLGVLSGARLIQDQDNPLAIHDIITSDGKVIPITSSHHQAVYPYQMPEEDYELLAWTEGISKHHYDGTNQEITYTPFKEVEIIYFPKTNCLGIQGHPEWMWDKNFRYRETFDYLNELLEKYLIKREELV